MKKLILVAVLLLCVTDANADFNLKSYKEAYAEPLTREQMHIYIVGVGRGIWFTNALMFRAGMPLFCFPDKLCIDSDVIQSLLNQEIREPYKNKVYAEDTDIEAIMFYSFIHRFPCTQPEPDK